MTATYNFGERTKKKVNGKELPVVHHPRYEASKAEAIKLIESNKYNLTEADFWILENNFPAKDPIKVQYSLLIITHTGCLKINDALEKGRKFDPKCVQEPYISPFTSGLVATYVDDEIRVTAEVSAANCKNAYPYAMLDKRLFDRVVLLKSKLAFGDVHSESESDDFVMEDQGVTDTRFDPDTGELLIDDKDLPIKKLGDSTPKSVSAKSSKPEQKPVEKPAPAPAKELMSIDEALSFEMPSKSGKAMVSLEQMARKAQTSEESMQKFMEFLKTEVKKKGDSSEPCLVVFQALRKNEINFA